MAGPLKLAVGMAIAAALTGSFLSSNVTPPAQSANAPRQATPAVQQKSWYSSWFEGMEFNRGSAPRPKPAVVQAAAPSVGSGYGRMELKADSVGQYHAEVEIEGQRIPMLVDTGATLISLTFEDAGRLGIRPAPSDYKVDIQTANGMAKAARVNLSEVRLGTLSVRSVDTIVLPRDVVGKSLLGMSFLKKLGGFEIASGSLVLRQ